MNTVKQLFLASSMTVLLSACGGGAGAGAGTESTGSVFSPSAPTQGQQTNGSGSGSSTTQVDQQETQSSSDFESSGGNSSFNTGNTESSNGTNTTEQSGSGSESSGSNNSFNTGNTESSNGTNTTEQSGSGSSDSSDSSESNNTGSGGATENGAANTSYPEWNASTAYNQGDRVTFNGETYEAGWWTQGSSPADSGQWGVWQPISGNGQTNTDESNSGSGNSQSSTGENNTQENNTQENNVDATTLSAGMYGEFNKVYQQDSGKAVVSYFVEWGVYGRNYHVSDIPAANLTHMLYGFLAICADNPQAGGGARSAIAQECANKQDYEVTIIDKFATLEKTYPGDTWSNDVYGDHYNGNFGQMKKLKQQYPDLIMLPSVGGWTLSTPFFAMANDDQKRAVFVDSVVRFVKKYDFFDGIDIDWEYPGVSGADSGLASASDAQAYTNLMRDLRTAFDELSLETGREYQITSAVGAGPHHIAAMDYANAHPYMDYIFMMTYDYAGAWSNVTGHHTSLNDNRHIEEGFNAATAVEAMLQKGVPSEKIVIGAAMYGRGWTGVSNSNNYAQDLFPLYGEATGPGVGTWEAGVFDYKDLYTNYIGGENEGINGFEVFYDEVAEAPYLWNERTGEFITYDSPRSIKAKADFINQYNLGGFLSWEIDGDNGLILNAMNEGLGNTEVK